MFMTRRQQLFYNDVPPDLNFYGTVKFNHRLPLDAPPGSVVICEMRNQGGGLNALFFLARGRSHVWHEYEPHNSRLFEEWIILENRKVAKHRAASVPENRPWEAE